MFSAPNPCVSSEEKRTPPPFYVGFFPVICMWIGIHELQNYECPRSLSSFITVYFQSCLCTSVPYKACKISSTLWAYTLLFPTRENPSLGSPELQWLPLVQILQVCVIYPASGHCVLMVEAITWLQACWCSSVTRKMVKGWILCSSKVSAMELNKSNWFQLSLVGLQDESLAHLILLDVYVAQIN